MPQPWLSKPSRRALLGLLLTLGLLAGSVSAGNYTVFTLPGAGGGGAGGAPTNAQYWTGAAHADLSAEKNLGALATGLVVNTTGTPTAYGGAACTNQLIEDLDASGAPTCRTITSAYVDSSIALAATTITVAGTANEITSSAGAQSLAANRTWTLSLPSTVDFTSKVLRVPNSTTLPGTCTVGDAYMDTDATTGQRFYLCQATNTWALQGDGGGSAYATVQDEGSGLTQRTTLNFAGAGVSCADDTTKTTCTISGGAAATQILQQVRASLATADPLGDNSTSTDIFVHPFDGNILTFFEDGTNATQRTFTKQTVALGTLTANTIYDVWCWYNAAVECFIGPAWANSAAGTSDPGTGVGTAQAELYLGTWVNSVAISGKCAAKACTHIAVFRTSSTTQTRDTQGFRLLANTYNRQQLDVFIEETTASWTYTGTASWRQVRATAANLIQAVAGRKLTSIKLDAAISAQTTAAGSCPIGIGVNSTTAIAAQTQIAYGGRDATISPVFMSSASYEARLATGYHEIVWLESNTASGNTCTFFGTSSAFRRTGLGGWILN